MHFFVEQPKAKNNQLMKNCEFKLKNYFKVFSQHKWNEHGRWTWNGFNKSISILSTDHYNPH